MSEEKRGLGLKNFLGFNPDEGRIGGKGREDWLPAWKEDKEVVVWLHTLAPVVPCFSHSFMVEDEAEDRETKKTKRFLRFPKFNSPDPQRVHSNQYYRDKESDVLRVVLEPPAPAGKGVHSIADPFLLLREWLRHEVRSGRIAPDQVVFEWTDFKNRSALIQWLAGELSGLEERGKNSWNHSLDTKLEYVFAVVPDAKPERVLLTRESKSLGECIKKEIEKQIDSRGDEEGDPTRSPYAFKWRFDPKADARDMYSAFRYDKAVYRDEIFDLISSADYPDPEEVAKFHRDDMAKMRAAIQAAAQIDLPLDLVFSKDPDERRTILLGNYATGTKGAPVETTRTKDEQRPAPRPPATPSGAKPPAKTGAAAFRTSQDAPAASPPSGGGRRRLKAAEPAPEPPKPEVETIPCDQCRHPMLPTETKCAKCGATYDIDGGEPEEQKAPPKTVEQPRAEEKSASAPKAGPKKPGATKAPPVEQGGERDGEGEEETAMPAKCWACGSKDIGRNKANAFACNSCGVEQADDIAFG